MQDILKTIRHIQPDFRTWLNDNHGITYTYEATTDVPYEVADKDNLMAQKLNQNRVTSSHMQKLEKKQF